MLYIQSKPTLRCASRFINWLMSQMRLKWILIRLYIDPSLRWCLGVELQYLTFECLCVCPLFRCAIDDTAIYTVVASNSHGQASCQATVIVKSEFIWNWHHFEIAETLPMFFDILFFLMRIKEVEIILCVNRAQRGGESVPLYLDVLSV